MYVRTNSILEKIERIPNVSDVNISLLQDSTSINLIKEMYSFNDYIKQAAEKNEPYIISRYLIDVAQLFSTFYNANKIIDENTEIKEARVYLTYCTNIVLKKGASLLGIKMPERM